MTGRGTYSLDVIHGKQDQRCAGWYALAVAHSLLPDPDDELLTAEDLIGIGWLKPAPTGLFGRQAIAAQPWCSNCGSPTDLTADHSTPLARGGHPLGPLRVLCRRCNSRRGHKDCT
jgi:5-methylcytosine-specific restriction endonuclease McrA